MPSIKVLLLDDEVVIKKVLREKVDWARFDMQIVGSVDSAAEALEFLQQAAVDLIITDIKMPYMDGNAFIEEAIKLKQHLRFLVLSAYTDFDIVRKSFKLGVYDFLQKSDINTSVMRDVLMKLYNEIVNEKHRELDKPSNDIHFEFDEPTLSSSKQYTLLRIRLKGEKMQTETLSALNFRDESHIKYYIIQGFSDSVTLLIEHGQHSRRHMDEEIQTVLKQIKTILNKQQFYNIGISSIGSGNQIDYMHIEAELALDSSYYSKDDQQYVFHHDFIGKINKANTCEMTSEYWIKRIKEHGKSLNISEISALINEMLSFTRSVCLQKSKCHELVYDVYYYYINYLGTNNIIEIKEGIETDHKAIYRIIQQFDRFHKLQVWIQKNMEVIKQKYILKYKSNMIDIIKPYISLNLADDLSLDSIAEHYNVNSSYISYLFKRSEGIPLKKYINNIRLEKAKDYLINTNIKIKDICDITGYNNPEHFSRTFKNAYGKSPNQYRQMFFTKK